MRADFYRGRARTEDFASALSVSKNPVCYNGDITTAANYRAFHERFPTVSSVMIGRGLVGDPALVCRILGTGKLERATLRDFHDELYESYAAAFGSRRNASLRMKELWFYLIHLFDGGEKHVKRLRKAADAAEFESAAADILQSLPLREELSPWE